MNKDKIQERIKTLIEERNKTQALLAMYEGALQDNQFWLQELDSLQEQTKKEQEDNGNSDNTE